ncbi:MAG: hypothetical protein ACYC4U_17025 [Pirellulaceae bacterium]
MPIQSPAVDEIREFVVPGRIWYRLHCSTWIASLVAAGLLMIIVVPGEVLSGT